MPRGMHPRASNPGPKPYRPSNLSLSCSHGAALRSGSAGNGVLTGTCRWPVSLSCKPAFDSGVDVDLGDLSPVFSRAGVMVFGLRRYIKLCLMFLHVGKFWGSFCR